MSNAWRKNSASSATEITVGANECRLTVNGERLVTRRAFSDLIVALHAPSVGFAGLLRFSISSAATSAEWRMVTDFLNAAVSTTLDGLKSMNIAFNDLSVYLIGGADSSFAKNLNSGKRLSLAGQRAFRQRGILVKGEDLGGNQARSLWLDSTSGRLIVRSYAMPDNNPAFSQALPVDSNQVAIQLDQLAC